MLGKKEKVMMSMIEFDQGDPRRIQHFMKVYEFAHLIGVAEDIDPETQEILDIAAILHDIGILPSEEEYGDCNGKHQEELGPGYARYMLMDLKGFSEEFIDRVCYLIGHHHTYDNVEGIDYQILIEADFLVNAYEDGLFEKDPAAVEAMKQRIFKTETGITLLELQCMEE